MLQPHIAGQRLLLRPFTLDDAPHVQRLAGNKNVSKTTSHIPHPYLDGMAEEWITGLERDWKNREQITYAVTAIKGGELLGNVSLMNLAESEAELGYWIGEPYWGQGYCTEAAKSLIRFAFAHFDIDRIVAEHLTSNPASGAVMKKLGMAYIGEFERRVNDRIERLERFELTHNPG